MEILARPRGENGTAYQGGKAGRTRKGRHRSMLPARLGLGEHGCSFLLPNGPEAPIAG